MQRESNNGIPTVSFSGTHQQRRNMENERHLVLSEDFTSQLAILKYKTIHAIATRTPESISDFDLGYCLTHGSKVVEFYLLYKGEAISTVEVAYLGIFGIYDGTYNCAEMNFYTDADFRNRGYLSYLLGVALKMLCFVRDHGGLEINLFYFIAENPTSGYIGYRYGFRLHGNYGNRDFTSFLEHIRYRDSFYYLRPKETNYGYFDELCAQRFTYGPILFLCLLVILFLFSN